MITYHFRVIVIILEAFLVADSERLRKHKYKERWGEKVQRLGRQKNGWEGGDDG
jgi:hypothetical protein